jgi:hypothetical protein
MTPTRLALLRARIAAWRKLRGGPKSRVPRWIRRHATQINGDQTHRRNRKARARFGRIVAAKGATR